MQKSPKAKKPATRVAKRVMGTPRKNELGEGLAEMVGKGFAKGWRKVGEWFPCTLPVQFPKCLFRRAGLWVLVLY